MGFTTVGLDGSKVGVLDDGGKELARASELLKKDGKEDKNLSALVAWWEDAKGSAEKDKKPVKEAGIHGGKMALRYTAYIPAGMAVLYLALIMYFQTRGGYKAVHLDSKGQIVTE